MYVTSHFVNRITAEALHGGDVAWVRLVIHEEAVKGQPQESELTLFMQKGPHARILAEAYANAINAVSGHEPEMPIVTDMEIVDDEELIRRLEAIED